MNDIPPIMLNQHDWKEVIKVLSKYLPGYTVWAFGSRVAGNAKPFSDLDLVILTDQPLSFTSMATIKDAFDESDITVRVDVVDWAATSAVFRKIIEQRYVVLQQAGATDSNSQKAPSL